MTWTNDWVGYGVLYLQYACSCVFRGYLPRVGARHRHRRNTSPIVGGNDSSMVLVRRVDFRASVSVSLSLSESTPCGYARNHGERPGRQSRVPGR